MKPDEARAGRHPAHWAALMSTGWLSLTELAERRGETDVGVTGAWVYHQRRRRALIALQAPDRNIVVPAFQVTADGEPRPDLQPLLEVLLGAELGGRVTWSWLTSPSSLLAGEVPERVAATDPQRALRAATRIVALARK